MKSGVTHDELVEEAERLSQELDALKKTLATSPLEEVERLPQELDSIKKTLEAPPFEVRVWMGPPLLSAMKEEIESLRQEIVNKGGRVGKITAFGSPEEEILGRPAWLKDESAGFAYIKSLRKRLATLSPRALKATSKAGQYCKSAAEGLNLNENQLTDVKGLEKQILFFTYSILTKEDMRRQVRCSGSTRNVSTIYVIDAKITDEALKELAKINQFREYPVIAREITEAGMYQQKKLLEGDKNLVWQQL